MKSARIWGMTWEEGNFVIQFHEFGSEHLAAVLEIYRKAGWSAYLSDDRKMVNAMKNSLYLYGAFDNGRLIGFVRCVGDGEHILYVQDLIVDASYKRQGIGRTLLQAAMDKYSHVRMFALATDAADQISNAFYTAAGMRQWEESGLIGYCR